MRTTAPTPAERNTSMISAIINLVCPECGGSMMEFRCWGKCRRDWRFAWECATDARGFDVRRHPRLARR